VEDRRAYRAMIRPHLQDWLQDVIADGDHGASLALTERLMEQGEDLGTLNYVRARIYMMRKAEGDTALAEDALKASAAAPDVPATALRELGQIHRARGDRESAAANLRAYLLADPGARDRALVESQIAQLKETPK